MRHEVEFKATMYVEAPVNATQEELDALANESMSFQMRDYILQKDDRPFIALILSETLNSLVEIIDLSIENDKISKIATKAKNRLEIIL